MKARLIAIVCFALVMPGLTLAQGPRSKRRPPTAARTSDLLPGVRTASHVVRHNGKALAVTNIFDREGEKVAEVVVSGKQTTVRVAGQKERRVRGSDFQEISLGEHMLIKANGEGGTIKVTEARLIGGVQREHLLLSSSKGWARVEHRTEIRQRHNLRYKWGHAGAVAMSPKDKIRSAILTTPYDPTP